MYYLDCFAIRASETEEKGHFWWQGHVELDAQSSDFKKPPPPAACPPMRSTEQSFSGQIPDLIFHIISHLPHTIVRTAVHRAVSVLVIERQHAFVCQNMVASKGCVLNFLDGLSTRRVLAQRRLPVTILVPVHDFCNCSAFGGLPLPRIMAVLIRCEDIQELSD